MATTTLTAVAHPRTSVTISNRFWMGTCEVTSEQFARFDATHDSGYDDQRWKDHTTPGYPASLPDQPAARAGSATPLSFCDLDMDFSTFANMADASATKLVVEGVNPQPMENPGPHVDYLPKDARYDDGHRIVAQVGACRPNA
ncbi:MAG: hypothetical protein KAS72_09435 [Phycisphaerales bacterium]|nr:hypothetical protein [Phycisphaerales bacterium]